MRTALAHPFGNARLLLSAALPIRIHVRAIYTCTMIHVYMYLYICAPKQTLNVSSSKLYQSLLQRLSLIIFKKILSTFNVEFYFRSSSILPYLRVAVTSRNYLLHYTRLWIISDINARHYSFLCLFIFGSEISHRLPQAWEDPELAYTYVHTHVGVSQLLHDRTRAVMHLTNGVSPRCIALCG